MGGLTEQVHVHIVVEDVFCIFLCLNTCIQDSPRILHANNFRDDRSPAPGVVELFLMDCSERAQECYDADESLGDVSCLSNANLGLSISHGDFVVACKWSLLKREHKKALQTFSSTSLFRLHLFSAAFHRSFHSTCQLLSFASSFISKYGRDRKKC